jgi:hypothetical protein
MTPRMLATMTPISWPRLRPLPAAATGVDDGVDDDVDGNDDEAELEDKDMDEDDKDTEDEMGVAREEDVDGVGVAGSVVMGVVVGGISGVVGVAVEAGGVRPPYVQSEFSGI